MIPFARLSPAVRRWARRSVAAVAAAACAGGLAIAVAPPASATAVGVLTGLTAPTSGMVLRGANGSWHYWVPDHLLGLCRVDRVGRTTRHAITPSTCLTTVGGADISPGQLAVGPSNGDAHSTRWVYATDARANSIGVVKLYYDPFLGNGNGGLSAARSSVVLPGCGLGVNRPVGAALGPDGNLYVSFIKSPAINRIVRPAAAASCRSTGVIGFAADGRSATGLAFLGSNLWETDGNGLGVIASATTAANGIRGRVTARAVATGIVPGPTTLASEPVNGRLWIGGVNGVYVYNVVTGFGPRAFATGFLFVSGVVVDPPSTARGRTPAIWVSDDRSDGALEGVGRLIAVNP